MIGRARDEGDVVARNDRTRRESGFTLVEVIIAVMIIALVSGAAVATVASSSRSSGRLKVSDRQREIASSVLNRALANRDWVSDYSCGVGPCTEAKNEFITDSDPLLKEPGGTVSHTVSFEAIGVDLPNDGIAPDDADRQVPDVYRIAVTVTSTAPDTVGTFKPYTVSGTLNMSVRSQTGTLRLHACTTSAGIDERVGLGLCSTPGQHTHQIQGPASGCGTASSECVAWANSAGNTKTRNLVVTPAAMSFWLHGPMGQVSPSWQKVTTANGSGLAEVPNLAPGRYELTQNSDDWKLWSSHSVPSGESITIAAGEVNDAVQVFSPAAHPVRIYLEHTDVTDPASPERKSGSRLERAVKLVPVPAGRSALANGTYRGWTRIRYGATSVLINDLLPGLYSMELIEYPGTKKVRVDGGGSYIWIPPVTDAASTQVPAKIIVHTTYCDIPGRLAVMRGRITPTQVSMGNWDRGFFWTNPTSGSEIYHSPCTDANPDPTSQQVIGEPGA